MHVPFLRALVCALLFISLAPAAALADGTGAPHITSPTAGEAVAEGWSGPVGVDFSDAPVATYTVSVTCDQYSWSDSYAFDGTNATYSQTVDPITGDQEQSCSVAVADSTAPDQTLTTSEFVVLAPEPAEPDPVSFSGVSQSLKVIYPRVRDGYRDNTQIDFSTSEPADAAVRVRDAASHVVWTADLGTHSSFSWKWWGRVGNGTIGAAGTYTLEVTATSDAGGTGSFTRAVRIATAVKTERLADSTTGYDTSYQRRTKSCYIDYELYDTDEVTLDCWGGRYALVTYRFQVPSNATNLSFYVRGYQGCCSGGSIIKRADRINSTTYRVEVKVTRWREYSVESVRVGYDHRYRI
jgi:hypothetical protein